VRHLILLFTFLALAPVCLAQEDSPTPKKNRLIFQPGELRPEGVPTPTPEPQILVESDKTDPLERKVDVFFLQLAANQIDAAYNGLARGTIIAERPEEVGMLKEKTQLAIEEYGPVSGYELISEKKAGGRLLLRTYLSHNEVLPLRWRMYFYHTGGEWKLVDFRVDDGLFELFDEDEPRGVQ